MVSSVPCGTTPEFGIPIATDEFDHSVQITYTDITHPGIYAREYSVTRIWTATDNCGNTDVCSRTIFVEDSVAPVMSIPVGVSPVEYGIALDFENATADDECDGNELITYALPGVKKGYKDMNMHQLKCVSVKGNGNKFFHSAKIFEHNDVE
ncbi:MAG: hypothetical protein IPP15_22600 [Saprospiraceae bacterium]|uniref:HYR domain-containing protein n=1 Tax=Candidatus Opimibacter skivensis TaxID=2982028 RepID=A0A9D7SZE6_9BACT|nr:hypothetical protein [Candidatus Opimibacter skivensis]